MVEGFLSKGNEFFPPSALSKPAAIGAQWAQWEPACSTMHPMHPLHICAMPAWDGVPLPVKEIRNSARASSKSVLASGPGALSGHPTIWVYFFLCAQHQAPRPWDNWWGNLFFFLALYLGGRPTATKNFNLPLTVYSYTADSRRGMNPFLVDIKRPPAGHQSQRSRHSIQSSPVTSI